MNTVTLLFHKYRIFMEKLLTNIATVIIYFLGIGLGSLLYHLVKHPKTQHSWHKITSSSHPEEMF
jgi:hypothetical protein